MIVPVMAGWILLGLGLLIGAAALFVFVAYRLFRYDRGRWE